MDLHEGDLFDIRVSMVGLRFKAEVIQSTHITTIPPVEPQVAATPWDALRKLENHLRDMP